MQIMVARGHPTLGAPHRSHTRLVRCYVAQPHLCGQELVAIAAATNKLRDAGVSTEQVDAMVGLISLQNSLLAAQLLQRMDDGFQKMDNRFQALEQGQQQLQGKVEGLHHQGVRAWWALAAIGVLAVLPDLNRQALFNSLKAVLELALSLRK